ncbi:MAG: maleylacetate reductase [Chitinophagales bacterium]
MNFIVQSFPNKIYFGEGQLKKINDIINELGSTRLFIVAGNRNISIVNELIKSFGEKNVCHFSRIVQHVPKIIADEALTLAKENQSDFIIAIGGGSAIGLAKAVALQNRLRILAVPTTYAGSEMTNIYGISSDGVKSVGRDMIVLPACVIYDPSMTLEMPLPLASTSSMNAMAHLIEALYAYDGNPVTYQISLMGIKFLKQGMEQLISERSLKNANSALQFGSYLAGKALCEVSMALHHKLAHVLGGSFNLDHSKTHTVLLPYVLRFQVNGLSASLINDLQTVLNDSRPSYKLQSLAEQMKAPISLKAIGFHEEDIPKVVRLMATMNYPNPVPVTEKLIEELLKMAYEGRLY